MARGKPNALNSVHVMNLMQQVGQGVLPTSLRGDSRQIATVGIDVLA